jgi:hypothetical protein
VVAGGDRDADADQLSIDHQQYHAEFDPLLVFTSYEEMNVNSRRKLREFYEAKRERRRHGDAFEDWFKLARNAHWIERHLMEINLWQPLHDIKHEESLIRT